jgi:hypothetical protein
LTVVGNNVVFVCDLTLLLVFLLVLSRIVSLLKAPVMPTSGTGPSSSSSSSAASGSSAPAPAPAGSSAAAAPAPAPAASSSGAGGGMAVDGEEEELDPELAEALRLSMQAEQGGSGGESKDGEKKDGEGSS